MRNHQGLKSRNLISFPLDIPDVNVISVEMNERGDYIVTVESTLKSAICQACGGAKNGARRTVKTEQGAHPKRGKAHTFSKTGGIGKELVNPKCGMLLFKTKGEKRGPGAINLAKNQRNLAFET